MLTSALKSLIRSDFINNIHWLRAFRHRRYWRRRDDGQSFEKYYNNFKTPNRLAILNLIKSIEPTSVYKYGCYSGPNLRLFSENIQGKFYGTDVNGFAIKYAEQQLPNIRLLAAGDGDIAKLDKWLPENVDVIVVTSVFYVLSTTSVNRLLRFFKSRCKYLVIGCHLGNFAGETTVVKDEHFQHPWQDLLESLSLKIVERVDAPTKDNSVTDYLLIST